MLIRHFAERPPWGRLGSLLEAVRHRAVVYRRGRLCEDVEGRTRLSSNTAALCMDKLRVDYSTPCFFSASYVARE